LILEKGKMGTAGFSHLTEMVSSFEPTANKSGACRVPASLRIEAKYTGLRHVPTVLFMIEKLIISL